MATKRIIKSTYKEKIQEELKEASDLISTVYISEFLKALCAVAVHNAIENTTYTGDEPRELTEGKILQTFAMNDIGGMSFHLSWKEFITWLLNEEITETIFDCDEKEKCEQCKLEKECSEDKEMWWNFNSVVDKWNEFVPIAEEQKKMFEDNIFGIDL